MKDLSQVIAYTQATTGESISPEDWESTFRERLEKHRRDMTAHQVLAIEHFIPLGRRMMDDVGGVWERMVGRAWFGAVWGLLRCSEVEEDMSAQQRFDVLEFAAKVYFLYD